ncbi:MAG TPA: hypothetical protein VMU16_07340 [Candidatus Binataceae bacterium]|nr:hypothetical protein [Candidatus Binataceae bacterium]
MRAIETPSRPVTRILLAIALVSGCTLAEQVFLTRLLAAAIFYHFSFLAVSLALLGGGAGAIFVYTKPGWFKRDLPEQAMSRWTAIFAIILILCPLMLVRLDYSWSGPVVHFALNLAVAAIIATMPFFAAGAVLTMALDAYTSYAGVTYAADLAGAGFGAILAVPALWIAPAPTLMVALGAAAALAAVMFATPASSELRNGVIVAVITVAVSVLAIITPLAYLPPDFSQAIAPGAVQVSDRWTPINRVVAYLLPDPNAPSAPVFYDRGYAGAFHHRRGEPIPDWRFLRLGPQTIGYAIAAPGPALVIGGGGGRDIFNALSSGRSTVDVIEINGAIRDAVDKDLAAFTGSPYSLPGVNAVIGDGRSMLASRDTKYAVIHIGFTDTFSSNSAAAFALTESNLYTLEAFDQYFDHLEPGGVLEVTRYYRQADEEALRATILMLEALRRRGVKDPRANTVVILGRDYWNIPFGTVLARLKPFTDAELTIIRAIAKERGDGIAFGPGEPGLLEWHGLTDASSPLDFCKNYRLNVCPSTDDKPFFFDQRRLENIVSDRATISPLTIHPMLILLLTFVIVIALAFTAYALPLILVNGVERPPAGELSFFAAIGFGYIILEIVLIQRFVLFLGFPTYALSVVLSALLVFTGIGSLMSGRFQQPKSALMASLTIAALLIVASAATLQPLLRNLILLPFPMRVVVSVVIIGPFGIAMGMAMPIGLRRIKALYPTGVPYAFGVNGVASVAGAVLAMAAAINFGFTAVTILAAAFYVAALVQTLASYWPDSNAAASDS